MIGRRVVLFLLLPALGLLAAGLVVTLDFFGDQGIELGQEATEANVDALAAAYVEAEVFADAADPDTLYLALTQATLTAVDRGDEARFLCLHGVYVTPSLEPAAGVFYPDIAPEEQDRENAPPAFRLEPPLCNFVEGEDGALVGSDVLVSDVIAGPEEPLELLLDEGERSIRFYPFDQRAGSWDIYPLALAPDGTFKDGVRLDVHLTAELADWEERMSLKPASLRFEASPTERFEWPAEVLEMELSRTRTQRLLTLVLMGFLTVLIIGLVFVKDKSTLLEIVIGVLLGLWGIQAVVIPDYIQNRTLVHYWVIVLYILLGLVTYVRLVGLPLVSGDASEAIATLDDELEELLEDDEEAVATAEMGEGEADDPPPRSG